MHEVVRYGDVARIREAISAKLSDEVETKKTCSRWLDDDEHHSVYAATHNR